VQYRYGMSIINSICPPAF